MSKRKEILILSILVIILFTINYSWLDQSLQDFLFDREFVEVTRIIDGDTIVAGNLTIRLLGINSPERGEEYYSEVKEFLEENILHKAVSLEFGKYKTDRYQRTLAYIFIGNRNINLELVEKGFANYYFPSGKDIHYNNFVFAWEECNENLCITSENICASCIELKEFDFSNDRIILSNSCQISCNLNNWEIKDEGRKKFVFENFNLEGNREVEILVGEGQNTLEKLYWTGEKYVWTSTGDTLFLRDEEGKLVLWESY